MQIIYCPAIRCSAKGFKKLKINLSNFFRRSMIKIANKIALSNKGTALVTGDAVIKLPLRHYQT